MKKIILFSLLIFCLASCRVEKPYDCGPVLKAKTIRSSFSPLIEIFELGPGKVFADVGASSGAYDVMFSTLVADVTFYIQDIDSACLNQDQLDKIFDYYSKQQGLDLRKRNEFKIVLGSYTESKLPVNHFDVIYSNATYHAFSKPGAMISDIHRKLKDEGILFIRDGFSEEGKPEICPDESCARPIPTEASFMQVMEENGFQLLQKWEDFQGQPLFKFGKK